MEIKGKNDILRLIGGKESAEVEFKSAKGGFPESFWETFSAFANTNGGVIVLGMKEKGGKLSTDGLDGEHVNVYKKTFWDCAHNKGKVSATMLTERDVSEIEMDGDKVLVFSVPRAPYDIRPVYLNNNPLTSTYKRNHEGDYHCTETEVRQMFSDAQHTSASYDSKILVNFTMDDIDLPTLHGYRQRFALRKDNHPWAALNDLDFLQKIGAYRVDRETGEEGFTRGGILMFGKGESITDQSCAPLYFVDYQEKMSDDPIQRWSDRIYPDGTWEANLYQYFFRTYNKLSQSLPVPFQLEGIARQEETSAHIAVREALVNTLVHCNYAAQGNVLVTRERKRIVFRNPGCMLVSVEDFYSGGKSICRNPLLQKFFVHIGYGERAGSGADYILKGCADSKWNRPEMEESVQPDMVTITFSLEEMYENNGDLAHSVPSLSSVCPQLKPADEKRAKEVLTALATGELSTALLMERISGGENNKNRFRQELLNPLIEAGLVERTIKDKNTSSKQTYRLTDKALDFCPSCPSSDGVL
ncbi:MAG: putative DNA binding domain-containing protein [Bacteroidales bacterium]|nr:putative DNA binding domain-containing protein [Bacteroidales bacterium]